MTQRGGGNGRGVRPSGGTHFPTLDVLRLVAAMAVLVSHSFALTGRREPVVLASGDFAITLGLLGVICFFVISGYLVTMSWQRTPEAGGFGVRRFARIWPGYLVVLVLAAMVLGPVVTTLSLRDYFADPETWSYVLRSSVMSPIRFTLPGVFENNPLPDAVNGSLWSLRYEVVAYLGLLGLGALGMLRRRVVVLGLCAGMLLAFELAALEVFPTDFLVLGFDPVLVLELGSFFLVGSSAWLWRDRFDLSRWALVSAVVLLPAAALRQSWLVIVALALMILWLGTRPWDSWSWFRKWGDPSYGTYLYAFPIQQTLVFAGVANSPWPLAIVATLITVPVGYLSWHLVERPWALRITALYRRRSAIAA